jgi:radical SAM superfamily enzyme YgiQ (UPF0313 family)
MLDRYGISIVFPRMKYTSGDPPLGVMYIATYLTKHLNAEVQIIDTTFHKSYDYVFQRIVNFPTDIVGIFIDTIMYNDAIKIAKMAKSLGKYVIAGGPHTTIMPETVISYVDALVIGEGELASLEILKNLPDLKPVKGAWVKNGATTYKSNELSLSQNLDSIPFPDRSLIENERYMQYWHFMDVIDGYKRGTNIIASRGCPYHCTYCQPTLRKLFGTRLRYRSPQNVMDEVLSLKETLGIQAFIFQDDTLTIDKKWVAEFADLLIKADTGLIWGCNTRADTIDRELLLHMHEAGLRKIQIGGESGTVRILRDVYKKGIIPEQVKQVVSIAHSVGVKTLVFFMLGAPGETRQEVISTIKFAKEIKSDEVTFNLTQPLPGTDLYESMLHKQEYNLEKDFTKFDYYNRRAFNDVTLSNRQLRLIRILGFFYVYVRLSSFVYIIRHFGSVSGMKKLFAKLRRVFS